MMDWVMITHACHLEWMNLLKIKFTTDAVFHFVFWRSCLYNCLSLLISSRRALLWRSSTATLFSKFWTYSLFLSRLAFDVSRFFSFLKRTNLYSQELKDKSWPYWFPVERLRAWPITVHLLQNFSSKCIKRIF